MLVMMLLVATFLVAYATGPAGADDLAARARRLAFPRMRVLALKGAS